MTKKGQMKPTFSNFQGEIKGVPGRKQQLKPLLNTWLYPVF